MAPFLGGCSCQCTRPGKCGRRGCGYTALMALAALAASYSVKRSWPAWRRAWRPFWAAAAVAGATAAGTFAGENVQSSGDALWCSFWAAAAVLNIPLPTAKKTCIKCCFYGIRNYWGRITVILFSFHPFSPLHCALRPVRSHSETKKSSI